MVMVEQTGSGAFNPRVMMTAATLGDESGLGSSLRRAVTPACRRAASTRFRTCGPRRRGPAPSPPSGVLEHLLHHGVVVGVVLALDLADGTTIGASFVEPIESTGASTDRRRHGSLARRSVRNALPRAPEAGWSLACVPRENPVGRTCSSERSCDPRTINWRGTTVTTTDVNGTLAEETNAGERTNTGEKTRRFETLVSTASETTSRRGALRLLTASAFGGLLFRQSVQGVDARKAADEDGPADDLAKLVQFVHPEKVYGFLPGLDEALLAALYGLDVATYRELTGRFDENVRDVARDLLADPSFARRVHRLPFRPGETVVGIGESVTDDLQSWLEILRRLLDLQRPNDRIRVVNRGIEGSTTTDGLGRFVQLVGRQPDWIICCLGAADAVRHGENSTKTAVSLEETAENLSEMRHLAATQTDARWVWITPPTVNERIASSFPPFQQIQMTVRNEDLIAIGDLLRGRSDSCFDANPVRGSDSVVDIQDVFGRPAPPEFVLSDGIHPSLVGQRAIANALVERLTAPECGGGNRRAAPRKGSESAST